MKRKKKKKREEKWDRLGKVGQNVARSGTYQTFWVCCQAIPDSVVAGPERPNRSRQCQIRRIGLVSVTSGSSKATARKTIPAQNGERSLSPIVWPDSIHGPLAIQGVNRPNPLERTHAPPDRVADRPDSATRDLYSTGMGSNWSHSAVTRM